MPDVEIRPLTPDDDMDAQLDLGQRAFGVYTPAQRESWSQIASLRISQGMFLGAFIAGRPARASCTTCASGGTAAPCLAPGWPA